MRTIILALLAGLLPTMVYSQGKATNKEILVIGNGETMVYGENCFTFTGQNVQAYVVTTATINNQPQYFVYEGPIKKGPFLKMTDNLVKNCQHDDGANCAIYTPKQENNVTTTMAAAGDDAQTYLTFNGKKYGPFLAVTEAYLTEDKSKVYFMSMAIDMTFKLNCTDGRSIQLPGTPAKLYLSQDGSKAFAFTNSAVMSANFNDQMLADMNKMYIVGIGGEKYGPFSNEDIASDDIWFSKTNKSMLLYMVRNDLYVNGQKTKTYESGISTCDFWLSPDGKRTAMFDYEKVIFSDGETYAFPFEVRCTTEGNKAILQWLSLENQTRLVLHSREL